MQACQITRNSSEGFICNPWLSLAAPLYIQYGWWGCKWIFRTEVKVEFYILEQNNEFYKEKDTKTNVNILIQRDFEQKVGKKTYISFNLSVPFSLLEKNEICSITTFNANASESIAYTAALPNSIEYLTSMSFLIYCMHIDCHIPIKIRTFVENNITFSVIYKLYQFTLF